MAVSSLLAAAGAKAAELEMNTAKLQAMDKITGRVSVIEAPVNTIVRFGSFSIVVRSCKTRPPEETPDNFAFVDVVDTNQKNEEQNIFKGWMFSSSPALNAVEHPIYDVWLLQCINTEIDKSKLLSEEQLKARDEIPQAAKDNTSPVLLKETEDISLSQTDLPVPEPVEINEPKETKSMEQTDVSASFETENNILPQSDEPKSLINIPDEIQNTISETQNENSVLQKENKLPPTEISPVSSGVSEDDLPNEEEQYIIFNVDEEKEATPEFKNDTLF